MTKKRIGIYFEEARKRWRVRLYKDGRVVHRSYHKEEEKAWSAWRAAKQEQAEAVTEPPTVVENPTIGNLLDALLQPS